VASAASRGLSRGALLTAGALLLAGACGRDRQREAARDVDERPARLEQGAADSARMARAALAHLDSAFLGSAWPPQNAWRVTRMDRDSRGARVWAGLVADSADALGSSRDAFFTIRVARDGAVQGIGRGPCPSAALPP